MEIEKERDGDREEAGNEKEIAIVKVKEKKEKEKIDTKKEEKEITKQDREKKRKILAKTANLNGMLRHGRGVLWQRHGLWFVWCLVVIAARIITLKMTPNLNTGLIWYSYTQVCLYFGNSRHHLIVLKENSTNKQQQ